MASKSRKGSQNSKAKAGKSDTKAQAKTDTERLPFEPQQHRKKAAKKSPSAPVVKETDAPAQSTVQSTGKSAAKGGTIPEVVSRRMARRMGLFCGVPTTLGMLTFVVSYLIVSHEWVKLPNVVVVLVSMGWFGLGVLGLSYGVLSASWDEQRVGTRLGWEEFTTNFGRLRESWQAAKQKS
ncbi:PAM68 family protein [Pantanalinema rosaneae CENA516]|uniref:PAM68 family protein n=1 Tax=Pantanalinema rosaneae TaxID=1620701 RepID=UPI003D70156A